jgi:hypothetical protein
MRLILALLVILSLSGCGAFRPGFVREDAAVVEGRADNTVVTGVDGPTGGHFNEDGEWVPDNPDIPMTYKIPDIGCGFIWDIRAMKVSPSIQLELLEIDSHIPYIGTLKIDGGVAYQRTYLYIGKLWTNIFEITTGGWAGWDFENNCISYGIGFTIIRF